MTFPIIRESKPETREVKGGGINFYQPHWNTLQMNGRRKRVKNNNSSEKDKKLWSRHDRLVVV